MATSSKRSSQSSSRDVELQLTEYQEDEYQAHWSFTTMNKNIITLPENSLWNSLICSFVLVSIVTASVSVGWIVIDIFDIIYNIIYAAHVVILAYSLIVNSEADGMNWWTISGFVIDVLSFSHYTQNQQNLSKIKLICYFIRLHRPFQYLWSVNDNNLHGSVLGTTLKYCYIVFAFRLTWVLIWLHLDDESEQTKEIERTIKMQDNLRERKNSEHNLFVFFRAFYIINKMFIPIGPTFVLDNDLERIACLLIMMSGCLVVTGAAVASLSLVISIYLRPEETFRTRYRLIMKDMQVSNIPPSLRDKVEKFYKMYWHKQRAVSVTQLLPLFPPSFTTTIYAEIYFKATQKSRILRKLSNQFLSELSKKMKTIHYIPGDAIIKKNLKKSATIYITYGDVEMLTAEDDSTAILRLIRGTILSPCAGSPVAASVRAHVEIRAATFCTAHVLTTTDLWKIVVKYGKGNGQGAIILKSFNEHLENVKRHYNSRPSDDAKFKSSILQFKLNLMHLKDSKDAAGNRQLSKTDFMIDIAGCYIMRNRADSTLTDESDAICLRPTFPCILQPKSSLQNIWNAFVTCLIIAVCITHPYYLVYKKRVPLEFRFFDYTVTVIYILDLVVHLSTGANVEDGVPITLSQTSSTQARSKWFVLDIIGTLPIFEFIHDGHFAGLNKLLRLPKVFRVLKSLEDDCVYHSNILRFISYSLLILFACYLMAALQQGFMCFDFGFCLVENFTHAPYWNKKPLDEETVEDRITFGLYWATSIVTFTAHMETLVQKSWNNIFYTMFVLEICLVLYIFIEAVYSATIMVTTALREDYDAFIENITNFLVRKDIDTVLRQRFIEYLRLRWYTDKAYSITSDQKTIFYDLPPHVYQDIVARQRSKFILAIPFMKLLNKEDLKNISSEAKLFCTSPNEILMNTGDMINEMYVIKRGFCEILSPDTKNVVGELSVRSHFGVFECLLRLPAFYTIRAATYVEVFSISRKHLLNAIEVPQIKDAIQYTKEQPLFPLVQVRREPFTSYSPPEPPPNVERFRVPRKFEQDNAFLQPFYRLGLLSFLRYIFPRFTIRPDGRYVVRHEWVRGCCAVLSATLYPGYTYLVLQWPWLYYVTFLLDLTAYFDVLQRMLVGYYNEKGTLVYHPASTAGHYMKGAFLTDLFGCLPLERLESSWKESFQNRYREAPIKQILMLNRLIQLYRMPSALLGLKGLIRRDILLVIKAIPLFLALLNVLTCLMVYCSVKIFYTIGSNSWSIEPHDDVGGSWIRIFNSTFRFNPTESPWNLHLGCHFWIVYETTTTGYGSFKPSNLSVMRVLIAAMFLGALITTYYSVRIISIRANVNKSLASFQEHIRDILVFMKREKLDLSLQKQVMDYYEYNWDKMAGFDYRNVLKLCDQITLRTDAILHIYGPTFSQCPILNQCDISQLRTIGRAMRTFYFTMDTSIIAVDDVISDIYIVVQGSVDLKDPRDETVSTLTKGSMFGNLQGAGTIRCPVSITTSTQVHLLQINSQAFFRIIDDYPGVFELLKFYRPSNENYVVGIGNLSYHNIKDRTMTMSNIMGERRFFYYFNIRQYVMKIYLVTISLICIYADVYNAGFQDNRPWLVLGLYLLDFCFVWKFVIQYFLPKIVDVDDNELLRTLMKIRAKYFKTEFKFDVLSFLPIEIFCLLSKRNSAMVFSWLRLNRLFRIVTVYKCLKRHHERLSTNLIITTTISVFIWFTIFVHVSTCLWYFIGAMEEHRAPKSSWIYDDAGEPWCDNYYICSLYFILTTFTQNGVGDILPKKQSEVIFVSILQIISTMMYMIYVGELSNIIQYQSFRSFNFYSSYLELQEFLKNNRVSKNLVSLVNKYSMYLWRESRGLQVPHFLKTAPNCFKLNIMSAAYLYHLTDHQIFKGCEPAFLRQLVGCLRLYTYNEDMYIVKEGEITDSMYIIHTGRVREISDSNISKTYHAGESFGELQGLIYNLPYTKSYKTSTKSRILTLYRKDWEDLLKHFPNSKKNIYKYLKNDDFDDNDDDDDYDGWDGTKKKRFFFKKDDLGKLPPQQFDLPQITKVEGNTSAKEFEDNFKKEYSEILPPGPSKDYEKAISTEKLDILPSEEKTIIASSSSDSTTYNVEPKRATSHLDVESMKEELLTKTTKDLSKRGLKIQEKDDLIDGDYMGDSDESHTSDEYKIIRQKGKKFKSLVEMESVEDYITKKHSQSRTSSFDVKKNVQMKEILPPDLKKRKHHVIIKETDSASPPVESHELKPILNTSTDERNLKSLDSDMETTQTIEDAKLSKDSLSDDSSVESIRQKPK
ncbi:unnamed protein product [Euphydryas editha]|uniref:Cyclic nucleotide-binding domain-containing protein n=1 Tax=Euphydryas editha TaxID=104508 RepID=A0AAU9V178_EUPED|nr:unnamed protein product [Euphydryas editha]